MHLRLSEKAVDKCSGRSLKNGLAAPYHDHKLPSYIRGLNFIQEASTNLRVKYCLKNLEPSNAMPLKQCSPSKGHN